MSKHSMWLAGLILAACLSGRAWADCEDQAQSMAQVRACIDGQNDKDVDQAYQSLLHKLEKAHADAAGALKKSQESWTRFASDSCDFQAAFNPKGMIAGDARSQCWADFSQARVRILKTWETQLDKSR